MSSELQENAVQQLRNAFDEALRLLPESSLRTTVYNARKRFFQRQTFSENTLSILRAEKQLAGLNACIRNWEGIKEQTHRQEILFEQSLLKNYSALQALARNASLQRALLFASHDLLERLPDFAEKMPDQFDKKDRRTAFSLFQYATRALFKTSPLSRFTTLQCHHLSGHEIAEWPDGLGEKVQVTPNVAILPAIYAVLLREPAFFQSLHLVLNPCITAVKKPLTWLYFDGEQEAFQQISPDPVVELVVQKLLKSNHETSYQTLFAWLQSAVDADDEALQGWIFRLVDIGLLEWQLPERGLSPGWCGGLYQYLGFLPSSPLLSEAAYLLQWLRTTARILPFQSLEAARTSQEEAFKETAAFLQRHGEEMPPLAASQLFFEDVVQEHTCPVPSAIMEELGTALATLWSKREAHQLSPFRVRLAAFAQAELANGKTMEFLAFSRKFLAWNAPKTPAELQTTAQKAGLMGALMQIYSENNHYKAVVNALYPGGGKMFARWLPLFPASISESVRVWHNSPPPPGGDYPWQGWSNANFQPAFSTSILAVPDGRLRGEQKILIGHLSVRLGDPGQPELFDRTTNLPVFFNDLGLEAPETRPPVMQVLWHLGMPPVSLESLWPRLEWSEQEAGVRYRGRVESGLLVLARATWELSPAVWRELFSQVGTGTQKALEAAARLRALGLPRRFFGQFAQRRERPQYYDLDCPISILLLEKNIEKGVGALLLTEMLPVPEQWPGERVTEIVLEWRNDG